VETFEYPIGVLLFNRPHLAKHVLESLKSSILPLNDKKLIFHIDGFSGSKNEENFESDLTRKTEKLVKKYFPDSHIIKQDSNIGIARSFFAVMSYIFSNFDAEFAVFQEEDVFLRPDYFQNLKNLLDVASSFRNVGALSVNDIDHYQKIRPEKLCPTFGTREFALRRDVFIQGRKIYEAYLESIGEQYRKKDLVKVNQALARFDLKLQSPFQDIFQHELLRMQGALHLRWNIPGRYDANFSNGESIFGTSIIQTLKLLVTKTSKDNEIPNLKSHEIYPEDFELVKIRAQENEYWRDWFNSRPQPIGESNQAELIRLRNRLKISRINHLIEYLYARKVRRGF
jgi:hypothetical protein